MQERKPKTTSKKPSKTAARRDYAAYRKQYITIYFNDPEVKELVLKAAKKGEVSVSEFVSQACRGAAVRELKQKTCGSCKGTGRVAA